MKRASVVDVVPLARAKRGRPRNVDAAPIVKKKINSRSKGQRGEREIVELLESIAWPIYRQLGKPLPRIERNQNQSNAGGCDISGLPYLAIEVKMQERLELDAWCRQLIAEAPKGATMVLFYRQSRKPWRVCCFGALYSRVDPRDRPHEKDHLTFGIFETSLSSARRWLSRLVWLEAPLHINYAVAVPIFA